MDGSEELTYGAEPDEVDGILTEPGSAEQLLVQMTNSELCPLLAHAESDMGVKVTQETLEQLRQGRAVLYRLGDRGEMWLIQPDQSQTRAEQYDDLSVQGIEMAGAVDISGTDLVDEHCAAEHEGILDEVDPSQIPGTSTVEETNSERTDGSEKTQFNPVVTSVQQKKLNQAHTTPLASGKQTARSGPVHQCGECGASFGSVFHLTRHSHTHTGLRPFKCNRCSVQFRHKTSLNVHMRKHTGEMPYVCSSCDKQFRDPANFKVHVRSHTKERNYVCKLCDKRFNSASTLYAHKKTHDGSKPYSCPECQKSFRFNTTLTRHVRTHTGEKPYKCDECDQDFATASNLSAHKRRHEMSTFSRVRPHPAMYKCDACDKDFHTKGGLKIHRKQHADHPKKKTVSDMVKSSSSVKINATKSVEVIAHGKLKSSPTPARAAEDWLIPPKNIKSETPSTSSVHDLTEKSESLSSQTDSEEKSFQDSELQCSTCGKTFSNSSIFVAHARTHNLSKGISVVYTVQSVR